MAPSPPPTSNPQPPPQPTGLLKQLTSQETGIVLALAAALVAVPIWFYESVRIPTLESRKDLAEQSKALAEQKLNDATTNLTKATEERDKLNIEITTLRQQLQGSVAVIQPIASIPNSTSLSSIANQFDRYNLYYSGPNDFVGLNLFISKDYQAKLNNPQEIEIHIIFSEGTNALDLCIHDENKTKNCVQLNRELGSLIEGEDPRKRAFRFSMRNNFPEINSFRITHLTFDISEGFQNGAGGFAVSHVEFK